MQRSFDAELISLKDQLLSMGHLVEKSLTHAVQGLTERNPSYFDQVEITESKIDRLHKDIDEGALKLLARHAPLAADLRMILAMIKINADLERMGDQALNISQTSRLYIAEEPIKPLVDLPKMAEEVKVMVKQALDAFVQKNTALAQEVIRRDDTVDELKRKIFRELIEFMKRDASVTERALDLILIARNLERLGDHATNIAEDVIFACTGEDIRHASLSEKQ